MQKKWLLVVAALHVVAAAFVAGYWIGGERAMHLPIHTADGYVGAATACFQDGVLTYGFESSVAWPTRTGVYNTSTSAYVMT